eukprot:990637-Amphidinium_carterae.1
MDRYGFKPGLKANKRCSTNKGGGFYKLILSLLVLVIRRRQTTPTLDECILPHEDSFVSWPEATNGKEPSLQLTPF